jgi:hypothetical protein
MHLQFGNAQSITENQIEILVFFFDNRYACFVEQVFPRSLLHGGTNHHFNDQTRDPLAISRAPDVVVSRAGSTAAVNVDQVAATCSRQRCVCSVSLPLSHVWLSLG